MFDLSTAPVLDGFLALAFAGVGLFNLVAPNRGRWNFSRRYRYVPSVSLLAAAVLLTSPSYRLAGAILGAFALFAIVVKLLDRSAYTGALLGIALLGALWARVLIGPL